MFPGINGFHWSAGHLTFLAIFFSVVALVAVTVAFAAWRSARDFRARRMEEIRWHCDFHDLPERDRACRHEIAGDLRRRTCPEAFECGECAAHAKLLERLPAATPEPRVEEVLGMKYPLDRYYHRGHTWVHPESDGNVTIGLDEFATRALNGAALRLPNPGDRLTANTAGWTARKGDAEVRVLAPVDGEVIATGSNGWLLKLKPEGGMGHLLRGREVAPWARREVERLQMALAGSANLADGGVVDLTCAGDWDTVCGAVFLAP